MLLCLVTPLKADVLAADFKLRGAVLLMTEDDIPRLGKTLPPKALPLASLLLAIPCVLLCSTAVASIAAIELPTCMKMLDRVAPAYACRLL